MFASNSHQLAGFSSRVENNMSTTSLQVSESSSFFTDNLMIGPSTGCYPDVNTFHGEASDSDYSKGIYNLRPRGSVPPAVASVAPRFELEKAVPQPVKPKRARNSLKKRLLVNARERDRMRVLNNGFQALRDALPCYIADGHMAKITTLRLAINYIKALTEVLTEEEAPSCAPVLRCTERSYGPPAPCPTAMMVVPTNEQALKPPSLPIEVLSSCSI